MRKKVLLILLAVLLVIGLAAPATALAGTRFTDNNWATYSTYTVGDGIMEYKLIAGQFIEVGTVTVSYVGTNLNVTYDVSPPW